MHKGKPHDASIMKSIGWRWWHWAREADLRHRRSRSVPRKSLRSVQQADPANFGPDLGHPIRRPQRLRHGVDRFFTAVDEKCSRRVDGRGREASRTAYLDLRLRPALKIP